MAVVEATAECFVINSAVIVSGNLIDSLYFLREQLKTRRHYRVSYTIMQMCAAFTRARSARTHTLSVLKVPAT